MRLASLRLRIIGACVPLALALGVALPAMADVMTIEQAMSELEMGAYFMVIGEVVEWKSGRLYEIQDDTGSMLIYLPENIERGKSDTVAQPLDDMEQLQTGDRLRLWGQLDDTPLNPDTHGMRVFRMTKLGDGLGGRGAPAPVEALTPAIVVPEQDAQLPAALDDSAPVSVIRPAASEEMEREVRTHMQAYRAAEARALEAGETYARAAREAGANGEVDAAVLEQLDAAEAEVTAIRGTFKQILSKASAEGVNDSIINMIETEVGLR